MRSDPSEPTRPWTMTFSISSEPRCPGCCEVLRDQVITFAEGWAWCPVCMGHALHADDLSVGLIGFPPTPPKDRRHG